MIGTRTTATQVMTLSVSWLEVASHIVRLAFIMVLDGITNGNIAIPAVRMMQASVSHAIMNYNNTFFRYRKIMCNIQYSL